VHYELNDKGVSLYRVAVIFDGWYCRREKALVNSLACLLIQTRIYYRKPMLQRGTADKGD
jgi:hypothetical protein